MAGVDEGQTKVVREPSYSTLLAAKGAMVNGKELVGSFESSQKLAISRYSMCHGTGRRPEAGKGVQAGILVDFLQILRIAVSGLMQVWQPLTSTL